jgi:glycosyltransferase involved in cell wall biosynthesis
MLPPCNQPLTGRSTVRLRVVYLDHVARLSGGEIALARALPAVLDTIDPHVILGEDGPLVARLREQGISVEVIAMQERARDLRKDRVRAGGLDPGAAAATVAYVWRLRRRLRELRPDLVHTNSLKAALYGGAAGRLAGVPVIWHIRDRIAPDYLPGAAVRLVRAASHVLPSAVITNSQSTLDTLPGTRRGVVVSNTVVYDAVGTAAPRLGGQTRPFRFGVVGRLAPWKGQHVFLDAFARAFPDGDTEAWIIGGAMFGEDTYAQGLRDQAQRLGIAERVDFRGFREEIWPELGELDALVHCSVTPEPFGQVVIEGMAAGVPVIAAAAGGPAEIVDDGVDGLLAAPGDPVALANAMLRIAESPDLRERLAAAGLVTAGRYTPERTAQQILAIYHRVLGSRRGSSPPADQPNG